VEGRERLRVLLLAGRKFLTQIGEPLPNARIGQSINHGAVEPSEDSDFAGMTASMPRRSNAA
jgi:hypothetical protein